MSKLDAEILMTICDADKSKQFPHFRNLHLVEDMELRYEWAKEWLDKE